MKMFLAVLLVAAASADRLENTYLPPGSARTAGGSGSFLNAPSRPAAGRFGGGDGSGPAGPIAGAYSGPTSPPIAILRLNNDNNGDGTYQFDFETENRITQQETGQLKNAGTDQESTVVQGSYSYAAPDGQTITVNYIADENGFQPQGAHLPTAPPVPEEILKALEQNAKDEAAGIIDDGQYRAEQQGPGAFRAGGGAGAGGAVNRQYLAPSASGNRQSGYRY